MEYVNNYIETLRRISSRYDIPSKITDDFIESICSRPGTIESIWGFCCKDMSNRDFSEASPAALFRMAFNDFTIWPTSLAQFDHCNILDQGKSPGLLIGKLHEKGITGSGVGIAVIDKPMLSTHSEFLDNLRSYVNVVEGHEDNDRMHFHGITCSGFACGKTVGVAPGASLYYYAFPDRFYDETMYWSYYYAALDQIVEHNRKSDDKIRVVSISAGIPSNQPQLSEKLDTYVNELAEDGCHVIYSNVFGRVFTCASRVYGTNPDDSDGYVLDTWQTNVWDRERILVPSGGRTSPCNSGIYQYMYNGNQSCYSWAIPYIAGMFALGLQIDNKLTYDKFCLFAQQTAVKNNMNLKVLNPMLLIDRISMG